MALLILSIAACLLAAGFLGKLVVIFVQREQISPKPKNPPKDWPKVSIIVPARNEEHNIRRCIESIAVQTYPADRLQIIVVDDDSDDATPEILAELQSQYPTIQPIQGRPLPKGWFGKSNACAHGSESADGDYLFFLDADTWAEPEMLKAVVSFMMERDIDLLSLNPFQNMISPAEQAFLPGIFTAIATAMRFQESNTPGKPFAMASGQFMAFKASAYHNVGGHPAVATVLEEDMTFAKLIKESGHKLYWAFGDSIMNTRMYTDLPGIWEGFSKNLMKIMSIETAPGMVFCAIRFLLLAWLPPIALILNLMCAGHPIGTAIAVITQLALLIMFIATVVTLKVPLFFALTFPLGLTLHALMLVQNYKAKKNSSITWKGRTME